MNTDLPKTLVETVAERLHDDMNRRNLRPGDRYMTAAQASEWLAASPVTVNRAMQILADQNLLVRRRSRGTYVGPEFRANGHEPRLIDVLHLVMAMDYHESRTTDSDKLVDAIQVALPGVTVEIHYIPSADELQRTERVVKRIKESDVIEGVILIRGSRDAQKLMQHPGLPAVVYGQVYPGISLSCVRHDQDAVGRLMAEHALMQGHRQFALLAHNRWIHGDNLMVAGLTKRLSGAGIALDHLRIRSVLCDREVLTETVEEFRRDTDPPTAFFCRSDSYAEGVVEVLQRLNVKDSCVISGGHGLPGELQGFARVVSEWPLERQMKKLIELIEDGVRNDDDNGDLYQHVTVPVRLERMED